MTYLTAFTDEHISPFVSGLSRLQSVPPQAQHDHKRLVEFRWQFPAGDDRVLAVTTQGVIQLVETAAGKVVWEQRRPSRIDAALHHMGSCAPKDNGMPSRKRS